MSIDYQASFETLKQTTGSQFGMKTKQSSLALMIMACRREAAGAKQTTPKSGTGTISKAAKKQPVKPKSKSKTAVRASKPKQMTPKAKAKPAATPRTGVTLSEVPKFKLSL